MGLKVIGAGLPRTGTLSLKFALEQLGFARCYHMTEFILNPHHGVSWTRALDGRPDWATLFDGYQAITDFPGCLFWRELIAAYPEAKVVLSVRSPESWYDSLSETICNESHQAALAASPIGATLLKLRARGGLCRNRDAMIAAFEAHIADVRATVPPEQLLVFEARQGWAPLCDFLDLPPPDAPYPCFNSRAKACALVGQAGPKVSFEDMRNHILSQYAFAS